MATPGYPGKEGSARIAYAPLQLHYLGEGRAQSHRTATATPWRRAPIAYGCIYPGIMVCCHLNIQPQDRVNKAKKRKSEQSRAEQRQKPDLYSAKLIFPLTN